MGGNESKNLPGFGSLDELVEFFDSHDLGEYWDQMPEVHFEVGIKRKAHLFTLNADLASELMRIAESRQVSSEALIHTWLREKILEQA